MKRGAHLLPLVLAPLLGAAQPLSKALLWRIHAPGGGPHGYLYGTIHSPDERAYTWAGAVETVMPEVATVAGELDLDKVMNARGGMTLMHRVMIPDGGRLENLYSKKQWKEAEPLLRERLGVTYGMLSRMKPFFVMSALAEGGMSADRPQMLDAHLMARAKELERRVIGLETMNEQLDAIDALPLKEQAAALLTVLRRGVSAEMDEMHDTYAAQDLDHMLHMMTSSPTMPPKLHGPFIRDRNHVMAHRMDSVLHADGSALFLVGAGHLPGTEGVIMLLRGRGYSVEPVDMATMGMPEPPLPPSWLLEGGYRYHHDSLGFEVDMPVQPGPADVDEKAWTIVAEQGRLKVMMMVVRGDVVPAEEELAELEDLLEQKVFTDVEPERRTVQLGGREGKRLIYAAGDRYMEMLAVARDRRLYLCIAMQQGGEREQVTTVIDSFSFRPWKDRENRLVHPEDK